MAITLPLSVLVSFIPAYLLGVGLNIMSLGGIILAVGDIVDGVVVFLENAHKKLAEHKSLDEATRKQIVTDACAELGPSLFSSLLIIAVSFLPIFALQAQEGKLFHPLAWTKTFAMLSAALVSITVAPPLVWIFARDRIRLEHENPLNRALQALYRPILGLALRAKALVVVLTAALVVVAGLGFSRIGSEFMPPFWEGESIAAVTEIAGNEA